MPPLGKFLIISLKGEEVIEFQYFPPAIKSSAKANWIAQNAAGGEMPLVYANRDPRKITIEELWLDKSTANESITLDIERLFSLQNEFQTRSKEGALLSSEPPALCLAWGDRRERPVVLEEIEVDEVLMNRQGSPVRARVSLTFVRLQTREEVTVTINEGDFPVLEDSPRPVFGPQP